MIIGVGLDLFCCSISYTQDGVLSLTNILGQFCDMYLKTFIVYMRVYII